MKELMDLWRTSRLRLTMALIGTISIIAFLVVTHATVEDGIPQFQCTTNDYFRICVDVKTKCEYFKELREPDKAFTFRVGSCKL